MSTSPEISGTLGSLDYPTQLNPNIFRRVTGLAARRLNTVEEFAPGVIEEIVEHHESDGSFILSSSHQRQWDPGVIGGVVERHPELNFLLEDTGIIAKSDLWKNPLTRWLVKNANCVAVERPAKDEDFKNEIERKASNFEKMKYAVDWVNDGHHLLIFGEGGTKEEDESGKRRTVESGKVRPLKPGIGIIPSLMTAEELERVRILPYATFYTGGVLEAALGAQNHFTYIGNLLVPSSDGRETIRLAQEQLENTMARAIALAIRTKFGLEY